MKIALMHLGRTGAGPLLTLELAKALIVARHEVAIVYSANAEIADQFALLDVARLPVRTFDTRLGAAFGLLRLPSLAHRFSHFLHEFRADVVVVTMEQVWQGLLPRGFAAGKPVLHMVHDGRMHDGEHSRLGHWLRDRERRRASSFITLSEHVAAEVRYQFPRKPVHTTVHPAFLAENVRARTEIAGMPVIGFFGRMSRYKGLELGVEAVSALRARGFPVRFHVAGQGIPLDIPGISHEDNILDDRWIPQSEVEATVEQFDCVLLPYTEASQSGVLAYAVALGIPSVATPVGGLQEQARMSGAALVAEAVTAEALADSLQLLLEDGDLYGELSRNALANARGALSWERVAVDLIDAAEKALAPK